MEVSNSIAFLDTKFHLEDALIEWPSMGFGDTFNMQSCNKAVLWKSCVMFIKEEYKLSGDHKSNVGKRLEMYDMYAVQYFGGMVMRERLHGGECPARREYWRQRGPRKG